MTTMTASEEQRPAVLIGRPPRRVWMVRAGRNGRNWAAMAAARLAAVDFRPVGPLAPATRAGIRGMVGRDRRDLRLNAPNSATTQLSSFVVEADVGDIVVSPRPDGRVAVGEITGTYRWQPAPPIDGHHHCREVSWVGAVARHEVGDDKTLGWFGTVREVNTDADRLWGIAIATSSPPRAASVATRRTRTVTSTSQYPKRPPRPENRRLILSRKGWDSDWGGGPSPILPDGRMMSLPIPDRGSRNAPATSTSTPASPAPCSTCCERWTSNA